MSIDAPKMPWKACDSNRFRVTFGVVCDTIQIGPETRWKRETGPDHQIEKGSKMAQVFIHARRARVKPEHTEKAASAAAHRRAEP